MSSHSSGCYVIDSEYNIVNANDTALMLYPQLKIGKKCYACLMGLDAPCGPCPVANGVKGPCSYVDPIRNITEIVDAVDINIDSHGPCHMLIFSTIENEAEFAATLPTSAEDLKKLALIKGLTLDYYDVFSVKINDGSMLIYRLNCKPLDPNSIYNGVIDYVEGMETYIQKYVFEEDQDMMRESCKLSYIKEALTESESMILHYRVMLDGELHYYYRNIVRIGDADAFDNIVIGVACEDEAVKSRERQLALQNTLRKVEVNATTGLLTQEAFFIHGDQLLKKYEDTSFDFCFLKIDNLDAISHQYGPIVRDQVVKGVGELLKSYMNEKTRTAYFGEGAFACLVESQAKEVLDTLMSTFEAQVHTSSNIKNLTFKWTFYKNIGRDIAFEEIINKIARVLNTIRGNDRRKCVELTQQMLAQMEWDISVEQNFPKALENGEFKVWFQPKYSVHTKTIVGAEALVRWELADGTLITPDRFIPILENTGLINRLDEEVFRQVCIFQKEMMDQGLDQLPVSVNLSRASLFTKDIPALYADIAKSYGVSTKLIPIEITESAAVRASMIGEFAESLIEYGFSLHMDDFGSGYSSLASLQMLPFECIKIDKSLVDFVGKQSGESLLKHTIAFAKETGLCVIAEGVERMEQYMFLKIAGCDAIQGYYFSKPVDVQTFVKMLVTPEV